MLLASQQTLTGVNKKHGVPGMGGRRVPAGSGSKFGYLQSTSKSSSAHPQKLRTQ